MAPIGLADNVAVATYGGQRPHVQGIASDLDDLMIRGKPWRAQLGDALVGGTLSRTIEGASELALEVVDPRRRLLNSKLLTEAHHLEVDGLSFAYVKASQQGQGAPLKLVYEETLVNRLRKLTGPHKAYRDKVTRAEFVLARLRELKGPPVKFVCPELHEIQPVKSAKDSTEVGAKAKTERGRGLSAHQGLNVEGVPLTSSQLKLAEMACQIAVKTPKINYTAFKALIVALIGESNLGAAAPGNVLEALEPYTKIRPAADEIQGFLNGNPTWTGVEAISYVEKHPDAAYYEVAQAVQKSGAGEASNGAANYGKHGDEADEIIHAFLGGGSLGSASGAASGLRTEEGRYAFQEKPNEDHWKLFQRLAGEVHWRCFVSAAWLYFIDEENLESSVVRMPVGDASPGIEDTSFDYDVGKDVTEINVTARARAWAAPPGSVALVKDHGPADGRYLIERIDAPLSHQDSLATITLRKPTGPLPEPPNPTKQKKVALGGPAASASGLVGGPSEASDGVAQSVAAMVAEIEATNNKVEYVWGGGHRGEPIGSRLTHYDCSGYMSHILHVGGLLNTVEVSGSLEDMYLPGRGKYLTIYANYKHVWGEIWTPSGMRQFECGGNKPGPNGHSGAGWTSGESPVGYSARHPKGF